MIMPERRSFLGRKLSLVLECSILQSGDTPHILKCNHARYSVETLDKMTEGEWDNLATIHRRTYGAGKVSPPRTIVELDKVIVKQPIDKGGCWRCGKPFDNSHPKPTKEGDTQTEILCIHWCSRCNQVGSSALFRQASAYWDGSIRPPWQNSELG